MRLTSERHKHALITIAATFLIAFIFGSTRLSGQAADEGAATGVVVEVSGGKIIGFVNYALVTAISDGDLQRRLSTGSSELHQRKSQPPRGIFTIPALKLDSWAFLAYKEGYDSYRSDEVRVKAKDTASVGNLLLSLQAPNPRPILGISPLALRRLSSIRPNIILVMQKRVAVPVPIISDYRVRVHVSDIIGRDVSSALVSAFEPSVTGRLEEVTGGFTDKYGNFSSASVPSSGRHSQYVLTISKYGYHSSISVRGWNSERSLEVQLVRPLDSSEVENITTTEASRRKVFTGENGRTMEALPLNGMRSFDSFALLSPGVLEPPETVGTQGPSFAAGIGTAGSFAINGLRARENGFTLDDGDDNDELVGIRRQGFLVPGSLQVEAIQEFQVVSALPDARFGRAIGGQVNVVTKPSIGGIHGDVYGFFTDERFAARDFFEGSTWNLPRNIPVNSANGIPILLDGEEMTVPNPSLKKAPFTRVQSGGTIGANVHNNFIFFAGERQIQQGSEETHFVVPSIEQRGILNSGATGVFINGAPAFPDTLVGNAVFSLYPFPNDPSGPYAKNTYTALLPREGNGIRTAIKIDHQTPNQPIWIGFRGNYTREKSVLPTSGGALESEITPYIRNYGFGMIIGVNTEGQAHTLRMLGNGTVVSLDYYRSEDRSPSAALLLNMTLPGTPPRYFSAASAVGRSYLNGSGFSAASSTLPITGEFAQLQINGFSSIGADPFSYPQRRNNITPEIAYSGTVGAGRSNFQFGAEWRPRRAETYLTQNTSPLIRFSGLPNQGANVLPFTSQQAADTGLLTASTLAAIGSPAAVLQTFLDLRPQSIAAPNGFVPVRALALNQGSFYFQHERQFGPSLRLTAGMRIEVAGPLNPLSTARDALYNPSQILADAQQAAVLCGDKCSGLPGTVSQAFGPNAFRLTPGNSAGIGPRIGAAWAPSGHHAFSIRGGFGFYTGQLQFFAANDARQGFATLVPLNIANFPALSTNGQYLFNLANPAIRNLSQGLNVFSSPTALNAITVNPFVLMTDGLSNLSSLGLQPTSSSLAVIQPSQGLRNPYSLQSAISTEFSAHSFVISAAYVGTRGVKLLRIATPSGGTNRAAVEIDGASVIGAGFPDIRGRLLAPLSQLSLAPDVTLASTQYESTATSRYNSAQVEVRRQYRRGLQFSSALTYSKSYDDSSDVFDLFGTPALPQNSQVRSEWGPSSFDKRVRFVSSFVWDVATAQRRVLLRNWQVSGIATVSTGQPFTVNSTIDVNEDGNPTDRLNSVAGLIPKSSGNDAVVLQLPNGVITSNLLASPGTSGLIGRNTFRGPSTANIDVAITRLIEIRERYKLSIRAEAFNLLNTPQFGIPQRLLEAPGFGQEVRTIAPPRTIQMSVKLNF